MLMFLLTKIRVEWETSSTSKLFLWPTVFLQKEGQFFYQLTDYDLLMTDDYLTNTNTNNKEEEKDYNDEEDKEEEDYNDEEDMEEEDDNDEEAKEEEEESMRSKGPKAGPKGRQIEVDA